jgi:hypothetical protein
LSFQSRFPNLQHLWTVVDAQHSRGVHGHTSSGSLSGKLQAVVGWSSRNTRRNLMRVRA